MSSATGRSAADPSTLPVLIEDASSVRTITLNRPARLNAIDDGVVRHLTAALQSCMDDQVRTVVLRGAGRAFSSGHDLKAPAGEPSAEATRDRLERLQELTRLIQRVPCPVITVIHGWAVGAGVELALASDFVMATDTARFRFPEVGLGLAITNGASWFLSRAVGAQRGKRMTLLGEDISAEALFQAGLLSHLVPEAALEQELSRLVDVTKALPPVSAGLAKELLNGHWSSLEAALQGEIEISMRLTPEEFRGERGLAGG